MTATMSNGTSNFRFAPIVAMSNGDIRIKARKLEFHGVTEIHQNGKAILTECSEQEPREVADDTEESHHSSDSSDSSNGSPTCCQTPPTVGIPEELKRLHDETKGLIQRRLYGLDKNPRVFLASLFPLFHVLSKYRWSWVLNDFLSGVIVSMIHLPQAMAGAMTAVMKPQHGLFMTMVPPLLYIILGTSPQNSVGGMPITAALAGVSMARIREEYHPDNFTIHSAEQMLELHFAIAGVVAFVTGIIQISMGIFKLGFLSKIVSSNVLDPFSVACCLQAICGQIPVMLGIKLFPYCGLSKHPWLVVNMFANLHTVNGMEALISALAASVILGFRELIQPVLYRKIKLIVPVEFFVLIIATVVSYCFDLKSVSGVRTMGKIPESLPYPKLPSMEYVPPVLLEGCISAIVSFTLTLNSAKILARKDGHTISPSQELVAIGSSNLFSSFFSCFVSAAPIGRSVINQSMGSKSQLSSLFGCIFMALLFLSCGQCLSYLPVCIIATNIVVTLIMTLTIFADLPTIWNSSRLDALIWISTFVSCILMDVRIGLITGIILSLFAVVYRSQRPKLRVLGRIKHSQGYVPLKYHSEAEEVHGIKILQIQSALHYANAEYIVKQAKYLTFLTNCAPVYPVESIVIEKPAVKRTGRIGNDYESRRTSLPAKLLPRPLSFKASTVNPITATPSLGRIDETAEQEIEPFVPKMVLGNAPQQGNVVYVVVLDLTMAAFIDSVGFRALDQLADDLKDVNVGLFIVQQRGSVLQEIKKEHILKITSHKSIFLCVEDAVLEAVRRGSYLLSPANQRRRLSRVPDPRFWPTDTVRVEGLPATNQSS